MKRITVKAIVLTLPLLFSGALLAAAARVSPALTAQTAPKDPGKELFELVCSGCHGIDLVTSLHNTKEQWAEVVQSMIDKGAYVKKEDVPVLVSYLAVTYGVKQETPASKETPAAKAPEAAGAVSAEFEKMVEAACSSCHGYDLVTDKRGSKSDWNETVRRMIERGAELKAEQVDPIVEYFAKKYPSQ